MKNKRKTSTAVSRKNQGKMLTVIVLLINFYMLTSFFLGEMGFLNAIQLRKANRVIREEVSSLDQENKNLLVQIKALRNDPKTIEKLARERLGLVKEGELVYEFFDQNEIR